MIQIGGVYTTFCQEEVILLQKYCDRNGRCIAILFKSIGVRGRFDSPDVPPPELTATTCIFQQKMRFLRGTLLETTGNGRRASGLKNQER